MPCDAVNYNELSWSCVARVALSMPILRFPARGGERRCVWAPRRPTLSGRASGHGTVQRTPAWHGGAAEVRCRDGADFSLVPVGCCLIEIWHQTGAQPPGARQPVDHAAARSRQRQRTGGTPRTIRWAVELLPSPSGVADAVFLLALLAVRRAAVRRRCDDQG